MRLRTLVVLLATVVVTIVSTSAEGDRPPVKLDKNLRRALLKALADLDTESAEQKSLTEAREAPSGDIDHSTPSESTNNPEETKSSPEPIRTIFSFDGFPSDDESPSEDKLQNSTFVESEKYLATDTSNSATTVETTREDNNRAFQAHDVLLSDKSSAIYDKSPEIVNDQVETRSVKSSSSSTVNGIVASSKPSSNFASESLAISSSNGIATANALVAPSPTVSSPTAQSKGNATKTSNKKKEDKQEVKIFQAPLVAAFTVQQDERGVPKSVVPIYSPNGDGQALTLQEQLDFKQKLLERQLAELQAQQIQQTQFLVRQQQIYEQQLRQKQQQQLFLQEQSRLRQIQEEQARLKQLEEQRNNQIQQQNQAQQFSLNHQNGLLSLQPPFKTPNVNVQPSLALELPKSSQPPAFQQNFHDQLRIQQLQRQQQQQAQLQQQQQLQQVRQQQLLHQQRLQQSFASFPIDFQPPNSSPAQRFNRQEAFGSVGNFGFNDNRQQASRNHFGFNQPTSRGSQTFFYNPYTQQQQQLQQQQQQQQYQQYRQQKPQTPAKQIQHLLYQSGVVGEFGSAQGTGGQEDLNIVSKVLALNVGAVPTKNLRYSGNNFGGSVANA